MENAIDYSTHTEPELVEMFGRMDPRYAPEECARLGQHLAGLGYLVANSYSTDRERRIIPAARSLRIQLRGG